MMKRLVTLLSIAAVLTGCQTLKESKPMAMFKQEKVMSYQENLLSIDSRYDMATTVQKLEQGLKERGMTIFATIDHTAHAKNAGLTMQPATVIVFGTPKAGTPLMVKEPNFALSLPLKVLITEQNNQVKVVMMRTEKLIAGTNISTDDVKNTLAKAETVIANLVQ